MHEATCEVVFVGLILGLPTRPDDVIPRAEKAVVHSPTWTLTNCRR